jgi:hypothetical protein
VKIMNTGAWTEMLLQSEIRHTCRQGFLCMKTARKKKKKDAVRRRGRRTPWSTTRPYSYILLSSLTLASLRLLFKYSYSWTKDYIQGVNKWKLFCH